MKPVINAKKKRGIGKHDRPLLRNRKDEVTDGRRDEGPAQGKVLQSGVAGRWQVGLKVID